MDFQIKNCPSISNVLKKSMTNKEISVRAFKKVKKDTLANKQLKHEKFSALWFNRLIKYPFWVKK